MDEVQVSEAQQLQQAGWEMCQELAAHPNLLNLVFNKLTVSDLEIVSYKIANEQKEFKNKDKKDKTKWEEFVAARPEHISQFSALAPPENYLITPYDTEEIDTPKKSVLDEVILNGAHYSPKEIIIDDYSLAATEQNEDFFNPLLYLSQQGNRALLNRIYQTVLNNYNYETHSAFGFSTGCPITDYVTDQTKVDSFVKAKWAICTYQSIEEFNRQYQKMLPLSPEKLKHVHEKLVDYACDTHNTAIINHLFLRKPYGLLQRVCEIDAMYTLQRGIDHGLRPNAALYIVLILLSKSGINPLAVLDFDYDEKTKPKDKKETKAQTLSRTMFWFSEKKNEIRTNKELQKNISRLGETWSEVIHKLVR